MRLLLTALIATYLLEISPVQAQTAAAPAPQKQQPTPEEMQKIMQSTFGVMVPMMGKMSEAMIEAQLKMAALPETADSIAAFKKNLFDALVKKGFTRGEALQIVLATGIPSASPGMMK